MFGMVAGEHYEYNSTAGIIKFANGSEVVLIELTEKPSDSEFTRLGGLLLTFALIDEAAEVSEKAFNILKSRTGRWKNDAFGIGPKVIMTCNPYKNWLYRNYYKPFTESSLQPYKRFIQALPTDNPYLPQSYLDNLQTLPLVDRQRLLLGNWDYAEDETNLVSYDTILNIFENLPKDDENKNVDKFITADIAYTSDRCVVIYWEGLLAKDIFVDPEGKVEDFILKLAREKGVKNNHIAYDSDGVGKHLTRSIVGGKAIVNNSKALKDENYKNLKTQLYFKLAEKINDNSVKINNKKYKSEITEELQIVKHKPTNREGKLEIIEKGEMKKILGRSPDFADALAYRMFFEYKSVGKMSIMR